MWGGAGLCLYEGVKRGEGCADIAGKLPQWAASVGKHFGNSLKNFCGLISQLACRRGNVCVNTTGLDGT